MLIDDLYNQLVDLTCDTRIYPWLHPFTLLADAALTFLVVKKVPYTEIDFSTYMQQVELYINGQRDYTKLTGSTGPLVYPALHVYIYSWLYWACEQGTNIVKAQYTFIGVYLVALNFAIMAYRKANAPPYLLPLLVLSKRLHSIYVLRLFNDGFAALFFWAGIVLVQRKSWVPASTLFSLAIGVKMTVLLALPGFLLLAATCASIRTAIASVASMLMVQVLVATPFLQNNVNAYLSRAFEFSRQFLFKWTVNWRFVGEETFLSKEFSASLLVAHASLLALFILTRWIPISGLSIPAHIRRLRKPLPQELLKSISARADSKTVTTVILTSFAIGILCARSLHYQFFAYLAWISPFLLWRSNLHPVLIYAAWAAQEWAWNVFPSTDMSSKIVVVSLALQVLGVWWGTRNDTYGQPEKGIDSVAKAKKLR